MPFQLLNTLEGAEGKIYAPQIQDPSSAMPTPPSPVLPCAPSEEKLGKMQEREQDLSIMAELGT